MGFFKLTMVFSRLIHSLKCTDIEHLLYQFFMPAIAACFSNLNNLPFLKQLPLQYFIYYYIKVNELIHLSFANLFTLLYVMVCIGEPSVQLGFQVHDFFESFSYWPAAVFIFS